MSVFVFMRHNYINIHSDFALIQTCSTATFCSEKSQEVRKTERHPLKGYTVTIKMIVPRGGQQCPFSFFFLGGGLFH